MRRARLVMKYAHDTGTVEVAGSRYVPEDEHRVSKDRMVAHVTDIEIRTAQRQESIPNVQRHAHELERSGS